MLFWTYVHHLSDPVDCFQLYWKFQMGINRFSHALPFMANNLPDDALVNTGFCQKAYTGMPGIMRKMVKAKGFNNRLPVGIQIVPV